CKCFFFFFQAEDGIRYRNVTGVQTCALPISSTRSFTRVEANERVLVTTLTKKMAEDLTDYLLEHDIRVQYLHSDVDTLRRVELRSEERRVGKECRSQGPQTQERTNRRGRTNT